MSKQTGLGDNLYIDGVDFSGDINSLSRIGGGPVAMDLTGIDVYAFERSGGLRDGSMEFQSYFNPAVGRAHLSLSAQPNTDRILSYFRGTVIGGQSANLVGKQINYDPTRNADGSINASVQAQANGYGIEWGQSATAGKRTDGSATSGPSLDFAAATAFGLQAYLHVFALTGTSVTVKLQESSDAAGTPDTWADVVGGGFVAATGVGAQRIETGRALAVERYLRVVTTGTFTNAVFAVSVTKNVTEVKFRG